MSNEWVQVHQCAEEIRPEDHPQFNLPKDGSHYYMVDCPDCMAQLIVQVDNGVVIIRSKHRT